MKIELTMKEIWALICTLDGVWASERDEAQNSAKEKLERVYARAVLSSTPVGEDRG